MTNETGRDIATEERAFGAKTGPVNHKTAADRAERGPTQVIERLRRRAESRVEKELDAFWDNVPL